MKPNHPCSNFTYKKKAWQQLISMKSGHWVLCKNRHHRVEVWNTKNSIEKKCMCFNWHSKCRAITLLSVSFQYQLCNTCDKIFKGQNYIEKGFALVYKEMETAEKFSSLP